MLSLGTSHVVLVMLFYESTFDKVLTRSSFGRTGCHLIERPITVFGCDLVTIQAVCWLLVAFGIGASDVEVGRVLERIIGAVFVLCHDLLPKQFLAHRGLLLSTGLVSILVWIIL